MTARLMEHRPASALDLDALRDAADGYINARACELLRDSERVAGYLKRVTDDEAVVAATMDGSDPAALGALVLARLDAVAQEAAEAEWEDGE